MANKLAFGDYRVCGTIVRLDRESCPKGDFGETKHRKIDAELGENVCRLC